MLLINLKAFDDKQLRTNKLDIVLKGELADPLPIKTYPALPLWTNYNVMFWSL
jgi:hypothetical protein